MIDLPAVLRYVVEQGASDLHVKVGSPPRVRVNGDLRMAPFPVIGPEECEELVKVVLPPERLEEFKSTGEADFSLSVSGLGRFRCNAFRQRGTAGLVLRRVLPSALSATDLGLPPVVTRLAEEPRGLVLVTGPTGSGKTTTLAAMVDHINSNRAANIITIEDPIEVLHRDKMSIISQREIGTDTKGWSQAMRRVLRQDPDVILIGEMRDPETIACRPLGRRDRPPRAVLPAHDQRHRDHKPHRRLLPAVPAAPGAHQPGLGAARAWSASGWCPGPTASAGWSRSRPW